MANNNSNKQWDSVMESVASAQWSGPSNREVQWNKSDSGATLSFFRPQVSPEVVQHRSGDLQMPLDQRYMEQSSIDVAKQQFQQQQEQLARKGYLDYSNTMQLGNTPDLRAPPDVVLTTGTRPEAPKPLLQPLEQVDQTRFWKAVTQPPNGPALSAALLPDAYRGGVNNAPSNDSFADGQAEKSSKQRRKPKPGALPKNWREQIYNAPVQPVAPLADPYPSPAFTSSSFNNSPFNNNNNNNVMAAASGMTEAASGPVSGAASGASTTAATANNKKKPSLGPLGTLKAIYSDVKNWKNLPQENSWEKARAVFFDGSRWWFWAIIFVLLLIFALLLIRKLWLNNKQQQILPNTAALPSSNGGQQAAVLQAAGAYAADPVATVTNAADKPRRFLGLF
jgi:hypothetical protein